MTLRILSCRACTASAVTLRPSSPSPSLLGGSPQVATITQCVFGRRSLDPDTIQCGGKVCAMSLAGDLLATGGALHGGAMSHDPRLERIRLRLWDLSSLAPPRGCEPGPASLIELSTAAKADASNTPLVGVRCVSFREHGREILAGCDDGKIHIWDLALAASGEFIDLH